MIRASLSLVPSLLLVCLLGALSGCGLLFHQARPDADMPSSDRHPWLVRCSWGIPSAELNAPRTGWQWAADPQGHRLVLEGALEDGFFRVDAMRAESDDGYNAAVTPSEGTVHEACATTVRMAEGDEAVVYGVFAARPTENVEVAIAFPSDPTGPRVTRMVLFSDSLSDPGNLKARLRVYPGSPYWLGRFTNGPNWADQLARATGMAMQNRSFGGAVAARTAQIPAVDLLAAIEAGGQRLVTGSIDRYIDDYVKGDLAGGTVARPWETVFVLWAGANDYVSKVPYPGDIAALLDDPHGEAGSEQVVQQVVQATADQVRCLYAAGARLFMVATLPDMGAMPLVLRNTSYAPQDVEGQSARRAQLSRKLSKLTARHNKELRKALVALTPELSSARIITANVDRMFLRMMHSEAPNGGARFNYGFAFAPLERVVGDRPRTIKLQEGCYRGSYLGSSDPSTICPEASRAFFWDEVHPSTYAQCWVAWFFEAEMARAGLRDRVPTPRQARRRCESIHPAASRGRD